MVKSRFYNFSERRKRRKRKRRKRRKGKKKRRKRRKIMEYHGASWNITELRIEN